MTKQLKCIIVDDEPPAIRLLTKYVEKVSFIELVNSFTNPLEALQFVEQNEVDLLFLDIQMPEITGIQLSKIISKKTNIIFTTAYPQFALDSYEVSAVDYLLKPIDFERFYKAVFKVNDKFSNANSGNENSVTLEKKQDDFFFFKTDGKNKFSKVFLDDILFVESLKNYVCIHLQNEQIITYNTLKNLKENLPDSNFIQVHKSYIVSIKHIDKIDNDAVWINGKELSIGNTYRKPFFEKITDNQL